MSMPIIPPFAITASYQNSQFGSGSIYTPGIPSVLTHLVSPPTSATEAETWSDNEAIAEGFTAYSAANEVILVTITGSPTGGTFTLNFGDDITGPIAYNASAAGVQAALADLDSIGSGTGGTDEVQTVTVSGTPTGGTFTLTYSGQTTGAIAYNAAASGVQTALQALSNIGANNVTVTGATGGPYTVTFTGSLADEDVAQMTATSSLIGGTNPAVTVTTTTAGVANTAVVAVSGNAGGPYTITFENAMGDELLEGFSGDGTGLIGGTNAAVVVEIQTAGTAAFEETTYNTPLGTITIPDYANIASQYDPLKNQYDSAGNNFGSWDSAYDE